MKPVNLNTVKWLHLCDLADEAALRRQPNRAADGLAAAAGRLTTVVPPHEGQADTALVTSFRWDCTAFGLADPGRRSMLAPGLAAKSQIVRHLLTPADDPARVAQPLPEVPPIEAPLPLWTGRADIGG